MFGEEEEVLLATVRSRSRKCVDLRRGTEDGSAVARIAGCREVYGEVFMAAGTEVGMEECFISAIHG